MVNWFLKGGIFMWPLLACSVLGVAFFLERIVTLFLSRTNPKKFVENLEEAIRKGGVKEGIEFCEKNRSPVARILSKGLLKYSESGNPGGKKERIEEAITSSGITELAFLDRGMWVLSSVVTLAPLLGFLGTVSGMIHAFDAIALAGEVEPTLVASGISEALITTEAGLSIAFPLFFAYNFFNVKINSYTRDMEEASNHLIDFLVEKGG